MIKYLFELKSASCKDNGVTDEFINIEFSLQIIHTNQNSQVFDGLNLKKEGNVPLELERFHESDGPFKRLKLAPVYTIEDAKAAKDLLNKVHEFVSIIENASMQTFGVILVK